MTWIIRWRDLALRNEVLPRILSSPAWQDIFSRVPEGPASYFTAANLRFGRTQAFTTWADVTGVAMAA